MSPTEFLGTGWRFPLRPDGNGGLSFARAEQSIEQSIWIILGTRMGERQMLPSFGCGLSRLVFGSNDPTTRAYVERRQTQGKTKPEAMRCLKRYIAREVYNALPKAALC